MKELIWHKVCETGELEMDDVIGTNLNGEEYAVYLIEDGYFASDGLCTHEQAKLYDGYVHQKMIECPKHNARFRIIDGKATRKPGKEDLKTYPVKQEGGWVYIGIQE